MGWDSFILYTSQYGPIKGLSDEQLGRLLRAIYRYNMGEEVSLDDDGMLRMAFLFIIDDVDRSHANRERISDLRSDAGKRGGAPVGNRNARKKDKTSKTSKNKQNKPNVNVNGNVNEHPKELADASEKSACVSEGDLVLEPVQDGRDPTRYERFLAFLHDECPDICRYMKHLATEKEFGMLLVSFTTQEIVEQCRNIENRKDHVRKYKSLYRTLINWCRRARNERALMEARLAAYGPKTRE